MRCRGEGRGEETAAAASEHVPAKGRRLTDGWGRTGPGQAGPEEAIVGCVCFVAVRECDQARWAGNACVVSRAPGLENSAQPIIRSAFERMRQSYMDLDATHEKHRNLRREIDA